MNKNHSMCTRCVMDTTDPEIEFDEHGMCNHCRHYDTLAANYLYSGQEGETKLRQIVRAIQEAGKGKDYDCITGLSGGVDSSFTVYYAKKLGLRPLVVHLDNGWNSEISVRNIENIVRKCGFDLYTYVIDWEVFKDLQLSFFRASVIDIEMLTDHAIRATMLNLAKEKRVKYILRGGNVASEGILPTAWVFYKWDGRNIKAIHRKFGHKKLVKYPLYSLYDMIIAEYVLGLREIRLLNYVDYNRERAMNILKKELDWEYYGRKHYESIFTKFYQAYILPTKFNIDKRKAHFSSLICAGQMTREEALEELKKSLYDPQELQEDKAYVIKKLGLTEEEFEALMKLPPKSHLDYPNSQRMFTLLARIKSMLKPVKKLFS